MWHILLEKKTLNVPQNFSLSILSNYCNKLECICKDFSVYFINRGYGHMRYLFKINLKIIFQEINDCFMDILILSVPLLQFKTIHIKNHYTPLFFIPFTYFHSCSIICSCNSHPHPQVFQKVKREYGKGRSHKGNMDGNLSPFSLLRKDLDSFPPFIRWPSVCLFFFFPWVPYFLILLTVYTFFSFKFQWCYLKWQMMLSTDLTNEIIQFR